jgi:hypothetical protein
MKTSNVARKALFQAIVACQEQAGDMKYTSTLTGITLTSANAGTRPSGLTNGTNAQTTQTVVCIHSKVR